jgi:hypothetical protein
MMPGGAKPGHKKVGGPRAGTPNKRSLALRQALEAHGCRLEEQLAGLLTDPAVEAPLKAEVLTKLLPYVYPQLRPVDPEGVLTADQAAGMLGAQASKFRAALRRHVSDEATISTILEDLRVHATNGAGPRPADF